jgi:hypothetical protein
MASYDVDRPLTSLSQGIAATTVVRGRRHLCALDRWRRRTASDIVARISYDGAVVAICYAGFWVYADGAPTFTPWSAGPVVWARMYDLPARCGDRIVCAALLRELLLTVFPADLLVLIADYCLAVACAEMELLDAAVTAPKKCCPYKDTIIKLSGRCEAVVGPCSRTVAGECSRGVSARLRRSDDGPLIYQTARCQRDLFGTPH